MGSGGGGCASDGARLLGGLNHVPIQSPRELDGRSEGDLTEGAGDSSLDTTETESSGLSVVDGTIVVSPTRVADRSGVDAIGVLTSSGTLRESGTSSAIASDKDSVSDYARSQQHGRDQ